MPHLNLHRCLLEAREMAEKALPASLPPAVRSAKLPQVMQKILERRAHGKASETR